MSHSTQRFTIPTNTVNPAQFPSPRFKYDGYHPNVSYIPQQNYGSYNSHIPQQNFQSYQTSPVLHRNIRPYQAPAPVPQHATYMVPVPHQNVGHYDHLVHQQAIRGYKPSVSQMQKVPNLQEQNYRPYLQPSPQQTVRNDIQPSPQQNTASVDLSLRVFTGRVVRVREWLSNSLAFPVLYRVYGRLVTAVPPGSLSTNKGSGKRVLIIEDLGDSRQKIRCCFQEIDKELGAFKAKENVVVVGRGMGEGLMQVFSVESFKPEEVVPHLPRMENFAVRGIKMALN